MLVVLHNVYPFLEPVTTHLKRGWPETEARKVAFPGANPEADPFIPHICLKISVEPNESQPLTLASTI